MLGVFNQRIVSPGRDLALPLDGGSLFQQFDLSVGKPRRGMVLALFVWRPRQHKHRPPELKLDALGPTSVYKAVTLEHA